MEWKVDVGVGGRRKVCLRRKDRGEGMLERRLTVGIMVVSCWKEVSK
jgi:hypothetical protein